MRLPKNATGVRQPAFGELPKPAGPDSAPGCGESAGEIPWGDPEAAATEAAATGDTAVAVDTAVAAVAAAAVAVAVDLPGCRWRAADLPWFSWTADVLEQCGGSETFALSGRNRDCATRAGKSLQLSLAMCPTAQHGLDRGRLAVCADSPWRIPTEFDVAHAFCFLHSYGRDWTRAVRRRDRQVRTSALVLLS